MWLFKMGTWSEIDDLEWQDGETFDGFKARLGYSAHATPSLGDLAFPEHSFLRAYLRSQHDAQELPQFIVEIDTGEWGPIVAVADEISMLMLMAALAPLAQCLLIEQWIFQHPIPVKCRRRFMRLDQAEGKRIRARCKREDGHPGDCMDERPL